MDFMPPPLLGDVFPQSPHSKNLPNLDFVPIFDA